MTFFTYPLRRIEETLSSVVISLRTIPAHQLQAERQELSRRCESAVGASAEAALLCVYDREIARRRPSQGGATLL